MRFVHGAVKLHPPHGRAVSMLLAAAWRSVSDIVDGHYLNVPHGRRPRIAVGFLQAVVATTSSAPLVAAEGHAPLPAYA